ncbi:MAG: phosphohistidine phosphatase SixA [Planctomycetes bacterium]|nr:phosphohistidine phosphatase SixA [Planctomycetota bacterium]
MRLYLVRHGKAASSDVDPQRGLTEEGLREVKKVADFLKPLNISVDYIRHSGKRRAEQTAEILGEAVTVREEIAAHTGLAPNDDVTPIREEIESAEQDVMIVGHLPFVGRLASLLLTDSDCGYPIAFKPVAIGCLEQPSGNHWEINWMVTPEVVPG